MLPSLFVSHGSPMLVATTDSEAHNELLKLSHVLPETPRAILCITAHWETEAPTVGAAAEPETIHDFYGFPGPLYDLIYPAPGAPDVARRAAALLQDAGFTPAIDDVRGLDHGTWVPLMLAWPEAHIPVAQLAIQPHLGPAHHVAMGRALAPLRAEGVLILGSGGAVHNLRAWDPQAEHVEPWAHAFEMALCQAVKDSDEAALTGLPGTPDGRKAHPRDEHYLPLLVAYGAGGPGAPGTVLHRGFEEGSLSYANFAFG